MDESRVISLIAEGESQNLDFKRELDLGSSRNKAEFIKDVISLANSADHSGYLLIGIDDDKSIIGIAELNEERIQQVAYAYISPPVSLQCFLVPVSAVAPLSVGVIQVKAQSKPHKVARSVDNLSKDDVFVRRGSVVMKASPEEIIQMRDTDVWLRREVRQLVKAAETHAKLENYDSAITSYSKAIEIAPTPDLFLARGEIYLRTIEVIDLDYEQKQQIGDLALKDFSDALALASNAEQEKRARFGRAQVWASHNHSRRSEDWDLWTEDTEWLRSHTEGYERGKLLYLEVLMGDNNVGIDEGKYWLTALNEAIAVGYDEPDVFLLRAFAHFRKHNHGFALEDVTRAVDGLREAERLETALCLKATVLVSMKRYNEAYECFFEARRRSGEDFRDPFGYVGAYLAKDILCRCGLAYEFSGLNERESQMVIQLAHLLRPWVKEMERKYPRIANILQYMLNR